MNALLNPLLLAMGAAALSVVSWRHGRWVIGLLLGLGAVGAALVAIRDLPGPVVVGLLITALGVIAVVTAWPLVARIGRTGSRTGDKR